MLQFCTPQAELGVVDYPDGRLSIRYRGVELAYRTTAIRKILHSSSSAELLYEPSELALVRWTTGVVASSVQSDAGRALGSAPVPTPVPFVNGRDGDVCIWWTQYSVNSRASGASNIVRVGDPQQGFDGGAGLETHLEAARDGDFDFRELLYF
jgi:hypothetical protein